MTHTILVVDDEAPNRTALERILQREGYHVVHAENGTQALAQIRQLPPAVMLTDLKMPGMSGLELLKTARTICPDLEVIVVTAYGTVESAVEAMKEGAWDFITKPLRRSVIVRKVRGALEKHDLVMENRALRDQLARTRAEEMISRAPPMRIIVEQARQVADSRASVLITGESGTGKGMLARFIHRASPRRSARLVTVNCAALPESLLESELFGHEVGAFTGATARREGRFELAQNGTLFLDEVTEINPTVQVKLLRVLQDAEYERVGGTRTLSADARIIAATNRDPESAIREGHLREDLYYRLNVIRLHLPPLRERTEDIPLLVQHFIARHAARNGRPVKAISAEAIDALMAWRWPGNVRELENVIERAVVLCRDEIIQLAQLPHAVQQHRATPGRLTFSVGAPLKDVERQMIEATLAHVNGDKTLAARLLGITARTIYRREAEWRQDDEAEANA